jgi:hypothetical protein
MSSFPVHRMMSKTMEFIDVLRCEGHIRDQQVRLTPPNGGVSSEVYLAEDGAESL